MPTPLANNGIELRMTRPNDLGLLPAYADPNELREVQLIVAPYPRYSWEPAPVPKDFHWTIRWIINTQGDVVHHRLVSIVQERLDEGYCGHLTNWGPVTVAAKERTIDAKKIAIKTMTLAERQVIEEIARNEPVMEPDGQWNCQDWVASVLDEAAERRIIDAATVTRVKEEAKKAAEELIAIQR